MTQLETINGKNILETIQDYIEQHDLYSSVDVAKTDVGYVVFWEDWNEREEICKHLEELGYKEEIPCPTYFRDEAVLCDCCHRVLDIVPQHAFWQPNYILEDGEYTCDECIDVDNLIDLYKNEKKVIYRATVDKNEITSRGFESFASIKTNGANEYSDNAEDDFEKAKEEYDEVIVYCESSTPFESETIIFVRNVENSED